MPEQLTDQSSLPNRGGFLFRKGIMYTERYDLAPSELDQALTALKMELSTMGDRPWMVLSDFDYTLCDEYVFDSQTDNHLAVIEPEVVEAAQLQHLVVATSRRATNPTIPLLWESGLVSPATPVITENGGTIAYREGGGVSFIDLVEPERLRQLGELQQFAGAALQGRTGDLQMVFKTGRTSLIARLQDANGQTMPAHQQWLADQLRLMPPSSGLQVLNARASVTVQPIGVSKAGAFRTYLNLLDIPRDSVYVIGMGDAGNDATIFAEADLSLGFSDAVAHMVDIAMPAGTGTAVEVFRTMQNRMAAGSN
jgi:hydroxymethylpyrimidine pyrophosphatase-like HAD family hydrolase